MKILQILDYLTGGIDANKFIAAGIFALVGVFLSLLLGTTKRDVESPRTPIQFDWNYFWSDNTKRFLTSLATGIIVIFVSLRFAKELFGVELSMIYSFGCGLGFDRLIEYFKNLRNGKEKSS